MVHGTLFRDNESWVHAGLGAATALYSPWIAAGYGVYLYGSNGGSSGGDPTKCCPNHVVRGAEYAIGYFGVQLFFQLALGLQ